MQQDYSHSTLFVNGCALGFSAFMQDAPFLLHTFPLKSEKQSKTGACPSPGARPAVDLCQDFPAGSPGFSLFSRENQTISVLSSYLTRNIVSFLTGFPLHICISVRILNCIQYVISPGSFGSGWRYRTWPWRTGGHTPGWTGPFESSARCGSDGLAHALHTGLPVPLHQRLLDLLVLFLRVAHALGQHKVQPPGPGYL